MSSAGNGYMRWRICSICGKKWNYYHPYSNISIEIDMFGRNYAFQYTNRVKYITDRKSRKFPYFETCNVNECSDSYRDLFVNLFHLLSVLGVKSHD